MESVIRHIVSADYVTTTWSGGVTTQVAIRPEGAVYADRDFSWRLSSATVELPESTFTPLPDYNRFVSILDGEMSLWHDGGSELHMIPYTIHAFDGGAASHSVGKCTDFNLMLRKGSCTGGLRSLLVGEESTSSLPLAPIPSGARQTVVIYCVQGDGTLVSQDCSVRFAAGEAALLEGSAAAVLHSEKASVFMVAQIFEKG